MRKLIVFAGLFAAFAFFLAAESPRGRSPASDASDHLTQDEISRRAEIFSRDVFNGKRVEVLPGRPMWPAPLRCGSVNSQGHCLLR